MKSAFRSTVVWLSLFAMVMGLAVSSHVAAQVISGDLVGTVLDKTGAVVPGAHVVWPGTIAKSVELVPVRFKLVMVNGPLPEFVSVAVTGVAVVVFRN